MKKLIILSLLIASFSCDKVGTYDNCKECVKIQKIGASGHEEIINALKVCDMEDFEYYFRYNEQTVTSSGEIKYEYYRCIAN